MFNSHIFSRFLRLVRSIRRSLFAFFVAITMLLATFVIAPTYALSAGENTTVTEKVEGAKSGSAKNDDENKQQTKQSESINTEPNKKNTDTSSTLNKDNKESKPVEKQQNADVSVDKAKSETAVNKKAKDAKNKAADSTKAVKGTDRGANEDPQLPKECKGKKSLSSCYKISYNIGSPTVDNDGKTILIKRGETRTITPEFKLRKTRKQTGVPGGLWFTLEKDGEDPVPSWANFEKDNGATKVKDTSKDKTGFDGSVTLRPGKWDRGSYTFKIGIYHPTDTKGKKIDVSVKIDESDISKNDLSLSLYDFRKENDKVPVSDDKIIIKQKSKAITNKLFIDSQSKEEPGYIHHHMICHKETSTNGSAETSDSADSYTLDSVNGLSLGTQTQFKHMDGKDRPSTGAEDSAVYENDDYTEESQSWISGTPTKAGTFECKVFAIKDTKLVSSGGGKHFESSTVSDEFNKKVKDDAGKKSLFEGNIVEDKWDNKADIQQGVDWDYKTVKIQVGDDDKLALNVYPFKGSNALTSKNNKISAMLGMELKPFVDATSAADSANKITLRVLCSKGKKKDSGSRSEQPSEPSQPSQTAGSPQAEEPLVYKTWSSNLAELGLSVPEDTKQTRCNKANDGDKECTADKVASQASMEVTLKPTAVGNYQCVVYALKPKALTTFDDAIKNTKADSLTPDSIKSALTAAPASFKEHKDFAAFTLNIDSVSNFTLPHTGGQSWNLQLGILAALLVNLLAAGFVVSQNERGRKLILGRWRGLCNHV
ncbi:hypothetical protein CJ213_05085 [Gardnerella swidsinskii]|uniref:LPXTG-motif protein cell wall anchor domain protein n=1 Tax=Gardnerella swidsinskii TaxID=2792979 RepID=A0A9X7FFU8_9BIFI|nr:hypothetical protein [Gardnerella swidsinskii]NSX41291.1 hypothetical protein [Gardnerella vaginalis]PMC55450.1 hypothetical protein CJ213_05085 [Gardnerella swidsinskii]